MIGSERKILTLEQLGETRDQLRREGQTVVQCHGCFEIGRAHV